MYARDDEDDISCHDEQWASLIDTTFRYNQRTAGRSSQVMAKAQLLRAHGGKLDAASVASFFRFVRPALPITVAFGSPIRH
jgi:hypothetical protein